MTNTTITRKCYYDTNIAMCKYNSNNIEYTIENSINPELAATNEELEKEHNYVNRQQASFEKEEKTSLPILNEVSQPIHSLSTNKVQSLTDLLLNRIYSADDPETVKEEFTEIIDGLFGLSDFTAEPLEYLALLAARGQNFPTTKTPGQIGYETVYTSLKLKSNPLKILDALSVDEMKCSVNNEDDTFGQYSVKFNSICVNLRNQPLLIHEITHAAMHLMFNNKALPYPKASSEDSEIENVYNSAVQDTLTNINENPALNKEEELLTSLINHYVTTKDKFNGAEIIATFTMLYPWVSEDTTDKYLGPLEEFWNNYISPQVDALKEYHIDKCDGDYAGKNSPFEYCISDIID